MDRKYGIYVFCILICYISFSFNTLLIIAYGATPQNFQVSICDMNTDAGEQLVQQLSGKYGKDKVIFCQCDVTDYPQYEGNF